jgi:Methyltransferase domain
MRLNESQCYHPRLHQPLAGLYLRARLDMYRAFLHYCQPTPASRILDVGPLVSADEPRQANVLERMYPYPSQLTLLGVQDGTPLLARYPGVTYVQYQPPHFPFPDRTFDIAYSNAVLEHVGDHAARVLFLREMARVSRQVYCTTPNRWYPLELHTLLPLLHWLPRAWHRAVLHCLGHAHYSDPAHLHLLSRRDLVALCRDVPGAWDVLPYRFGGLTSNWLLLGDARG